ncbi:MAG: TetR/AcrR family transcriptional regulator [Gammaproteobacteria bacterium]|jgi:AcrR family transcriptional regulator|nr:TetR/AcrR family transcriptional regulator [Gammaproteobacteria bacterium]MBQ0774007.1 TetR/AcrR family transcriptional regulator [Gammaproteobacteria bacterium]|tara:strand:+ start:49348 stop:49941 length:594 start_codon:yes stop_codon:yes gene_type:complete
MARPKRHPDSPDTRSQILEAARIEFAAHGIAAPLEAIAARCGIRRPSLLHHFPSKQALIAAVTDDVLQKARERIVAAMGASNSDYSSTLQNVMRVLRELEAEEQGVGGVLMHGMLNESENGEGGAEISDKMAEFIELLYVAMTAAGATDKHPADEIRAAIAHLVIGEVARVALGSRATKLWGKSDGIDPLFNAYFLR